MVTIIISLWIGASAGFVLGAWWASAHARGREADAVYAHMDMPEARAK